MSNFNFDANTIMSCKEYAALHKTALHNKIIALPKPPVLAIVQVGDNEDSNSYIKYKLKDCEECNIHAELYKVSENITAQHMQRLLNELNRNSTINGIIVQLPLPKHLDIETLQNCIDPLKDVDGFRLDSKHKPCTPLGVINWLKENNIQLDGTNVTVIGRGKCAGRPMIDMLIDESATVTACNSHTDKEILKGICLASDIIISCTGVNNLITGDMISDNTICIDVGRGDFASNAIIGLNNCYQTPVLGSTGLLTRTSLIENVYESYCAEPHKIITWSDDDRF